MRATAYEMVINNCAYYLRSHKNTEGLTAFDLSEGIAIGFCKEIEDVVTDIINVEL